jgi:sortase A
MGRLRLLLLLLVAVAASVVVAAATRPEAADPTVGQALGGAITVPVTEPPTTTTTTRPSQLPIPDALPADPYAPTPEVVVGRIEIPELGIDDSLYAGITLTSIDRGPGWWPGTAMPGEWGNVVVAGHRTTHSKPFNRLHELEAGDQVVFTTDAGRFVYEVRGVIIVPEAWIDIAAQDWARTATLFACHPPGSAVERIVVKLRLLDDDGTPADPDEALPAMDAEARRTDHTLVTRTPGSPAALAGAEG